ncbi:MAG: bactofilin family protein [Butyricimonas faecihominis]
MGKEVQAILNLLNEGVVVEGDIQTPRDIRIDGTLVGTVRTDGRLVLGPSSRVSGKVNSPNIDVFGNVEGDIATGIVVLRAKSNVKGTISAATMVVEAGAVFNGECSMVVSAKGIGRPETAEKK